MDGTLTGVPWSRETVYEDVARRQTEKDAKNQATVHELDGLNRVTKTTDPRARVSSRTYDGVNKVSERDKRGNTTRFDYDDLNRLTKTTDPGALRQRRPSRSRTTTRGTGRSRRTGGGS